MSWLSRLIGGIGGVTGRRRAERELDDELRAYFDALVAREMAAGKSEKEAIRSARVAMGSTPALKDRVRDVGWETRIESTWQDVRYVARGLRLSPGFTFAVVLTLALGIGANVGMFTLVDIVLLRPLSLPAPHELITLYERPREGAPDVTGGTGRYLRFSYPRYARLQEAIGASGSLAAMSAVFGVRARNDGAAEDRSINAQLVSGNYFETLRVPPLRGRLLTLQDDGLDETPAMVISASYWRRAFGAVDAIVGRPVVVNGSAVTIVGIAPEDFTGGWADQNPDAWFPIRLQAAVGYRNESSSYTPVDLTQPWSSQEIYWLRVVGRVPIDKRSIATTLLERANQQGLADLTSSMDERARASMMANRLIVEPFARGFSALRAQYSALLLALMLIVGLLLVLACANIAGLLLVRAAGRAREVSIRAALGATAGRIASRCLAESLLLALGGGVAGYLVGMAVKVTLAVQIMGTARTIPAGFSVDWRVMGFAIGVSLAAAFVFSLAPAIHAHRLGRSTFHLNQRGADGSGGLRGLRPIVVLQLAISVVVVFAATLLGRTVLNLSRVELGFATDRLVGASFNVAGAGYGPAEAPTVRSRLIAAATSVPGVASAAISQCGLLANCSYSGNVYFEGSAVQAELNWVGPAYFSTIGRRMARGREFNERDGAGSRVAVVTEAFARRYFDSRDPVGRPIGLDDLDTTIVGVVSDARSRRLRDLPVPMVFLLVDQPPPPRFRFAPGTLEIRVTRDPRDMAPVIRDALRRVEPHVNAAAEPVADRVARQFERERAVTSLASAFAALALLLAAIGLYGVLTDGVGRRTKEIGIRMALGAGRLQVLGLIVRQGAVLTTLGLTIGLVAAPWLTRYLQGMLFETSSFELGTFAAVALVLAFVAVLAAYLPARRATKVDPLIALRTE